MLAPQSIDRKLVDSDLESHLNESLEDKHKPGSIIWDID